jgi:hypothetical protein
MWYVDAVLSERDWDGENATGVALMILYEEAAHRAVFPPIVQLIGNQHAQSLPLEPFLTLATELLSSSRAPSRWGKSLADWLRRHAMVTDTAEEYQAHWQSRLHELRQAWLGEGKNTGLLWDLCEGRATESDEIFIRQDALTSGLANSGDLSLDTRFVATITREVPPGQYGVDLLVNVLRVISRHGMPTVSIHTYGPRGVYVKVETTLRQWLWMETESLREVRLSGRLPTRIAEDIKRWIQLSDDVEVVADRLGALHEELTSGKERPVGTD